ncbi:MAG: hypothetical protein E3J21_07705 [Anaerolineales bacterium]|nr:MAG: hypothetical protein E3J21_07705 [Anaerolineales bacterium]
MADAQAKAQELAALNDVNLGDVVSVGEAIGGGGGYYACSIREAALAEASFS